jgi:hypothetical protein
MAHGISLGIDYLWGVIVRLQPPLPPRSPRPRLARLATGICSAESNIAAVVYCVVGVASGVSWELRLPTQAFSNLLVGVRLNEESLPAVRPMWVRFLRPQSPSRVPVDVVAIDMPMSTN